MDTIAKGNSAEAAVLDAFICRGHHVAIPFGGGHPFDLVVHFAGSRFLRVQCKSSRRAGDCIVFNSRSTDHGRGAGTYAGLADLFGVFFPPTAAVYLLPVLEMPTSQVRLRIAPTRNNQAIGVRNAADYEFVGWTDERLLEVLAQSDPPPLEKGRTLAAS